MEEKRKSRRREYGATAGEGSRMWAKVIVEYNGVMNTRYVTMSRRKHGKLERLLDKFFKVDK